MKKLLTLTLLSTILFTMTITNVDAQLKIGTDKYYHATAGIVISAGMYSIGQYSKRDMNPYAPVLVAFTAGFAKEMYDSFTTDNFSGKDLLWTTASGAVTNLILHYAWNKDRKRERQYKKYKKMNEDEGFPLIIKASAGKE